MTHTAQDSVHGIALQTLQVAPFQQSVYFHMSDHRLYRSTASQSFLFPLT